MAGKMLMRNPWNTYLGDCSVVDSYLARKPVSSPKWFPLHFISIFLRSVGQPAFVNNPLLGLLMLIAIFLPDWEVGMGCLLGGGVATLTELILGLHPWSLVSNGVAPLNGVLVGTVTSILYPAVYGVDRTSHMWMAIFFGAIISVFICSAFNNFLGKLNIPYLALPFNIVIICIFLTLAPPASPASTVVVEATAFNSSTDSVVTVCGHFPYLESFSWCGIGRGIIVSMGQVYALNHVPASLLMYLAILLSSPLLFIMSVMGASIGSLMALSFLPEEDYQQVYDGVWGFNSLLAMSAVSCVFFPFSPTSFVAGLMNTVATVGIQAALRVNMDKNNLPVFTVPIVLSTIMMLLSSQARPCGCGSPLLRTEVMSYPEKQAIQAWRKAKKQDYQWRHQPIATWDENVEKQDYQECAADESDPALEKV